MIAVLKPGASPERTQHLIHWLEEQNLGVHVSQGEYQTVLGLIGNTAKVDMEMIQSLDIVESVTRVSRPLQGGQPEVPPGGLRHSGGARGHRRGPFCPHRRPLLGGDGGADHLCGPAGQKGRGRLPAGGRVQAPDLAL